MKLPRSQLLALLKKYDIPLKCSQCGSTIEADLAVYYKNGNHNDNRKENLQVFCASGCKLPDNYKYSTPNKNPHVAINISISQDLLQRIEQNIEGNNRSRKITKCAKLGYIQLTKVNTI